MTNDLPASVREIRSDHIENLYALTEGIYSGGSPHHEEAFAELQKLGVKTVISVDGSKPDAETARKFGLRYIHIPIGYDGVSRTNANRLIKAAEVSEGPLFIHCHHGKHRGPAAASLICAGVANWNPGQALEWMRRAGTSPDYTGLFKSAAEFKPPAKAELSAVSTNFPERATVSGLVGAMVEIDTRWEHLKSVQKAGLRPPPDHPDLVPETEAALLAEAIRELLRLEEAKRHGDDFLARLQAMEQDAWKLQAFLKSGLQLLSSKDEGDDLFKRVGESCSACHKRFRD